MNREEFLALDPEELKLLQDPEAFLLEYGTVLDQESSVAVQYHPDGIAPLLQWGILGWMSHQPRQESGHRKWMLVQASRQMGKSCTTALAMYTRTAYTQQVFSGLIADHKERAEDLFRYVTFCHENVPDEIRIDTISSRESRQLTTCHGSKLRTLSSDSAMVGIGRAFDNLQMSELPFWPDAGGVWDGIYPAVTNRKEALVVMESTPAPMSDAKAPSAEWFKDMCSAARRNEGRWDFIFGPWFGSRLNERAWNPTWLFDNTELRMLEQYGPQHGEPISAPGNPYYLTVENLAFRRATMEENPEIRRYPERFNIYFPSDPISCWITAGGGAVPSHALVRHFRRVVVPWTGPYMEYKDPVPEAVYVIGVDPAGWTGGDHASFQVLEVWDDEWGWEQCAVYSSNEIDPHTFARKILEAAEKWNNAEVIVENNGVGLGVLSILELATQTEGVVLRDDRGEERRYKLRKLYYHKLAGRPENVPGIPATSKTNAEGLAWLIDALMERLVIHDAETLDQLRDYKRDKEVAASDKWQIINPGKTQPGRRGRGHWDRVSALIWAVYVARRQNTRFKPKTPEQVFKEFQAYEERAKQGLTFNEQKALEAKQKQVERGRERAKRGGKTKYGKRTEARRVTKRKSRLKT